MCLSFRYFKFLGFPIVPRGQKSPVEPKFFFVTTPAQTIVLHKQLSFEDFQVFMCHNVFFLQKLKQNKLEHNELKPRWVREDHNLASVFARLIADAFNKAWKKTRPLKNDAVEAVQIQEIAQKSPCS